MGIQVVAGATLPLYVVVDDQVTTYVVRADVIRRNPYAVLHNNVLLSHVVGSSGEYANNALTMPDEPFVDVNYSVYEADGTTLVRMASEVISQPAEGGSGSGSGASAGNGELVATVINESTVVGVVIASE